MSSTGHLPELESLRSQVADLARELAERDQAVQAQQQGIDRELQDLRKQADLLRAIMEGTAADTGDDFFASLAIYLTSTLHMQYAVIGEVLEKTPASIRTLAVSSGGTLLENFEYDLTTAPCRTGLTESFWCFEQNVQALFPHFPPLAAMGVESHSGVAIRNHHGNVVGLIVMMDTKPIASPDRLQALLKVFASRTAAELHRKQAEHKHHQALHELQNIMETVPDCMFTLDIHGNMVKWNRRVEEVTGYSPEELHRTSALAFVPAQEQAHTTLAIQRAFTDGYVELAGHLLTKDQRTIPYHWTGAVLKDPQGQIIGITGIGRDVSEQKQATESLHRQRHHLLEAQALAHLGSWEWDIESGKADWSEEQFRIFGHEPGAIAVTYDTFLAALLPDDHDGVLAAINDALLGKAPYEIECRIVRPTGEVRTICCRGEITRDNGGHPLRMSGTVLDITERKQAEEALRASEERWHLAVQGSNDGIWDWNIQTGEIFFSARWKTMRGFADHEVSNHIDEWRSRIHPDDLNRVLQSLDHYLTTQTSAFCEEYRVQRKDGSYMWILDRGAALWADNGTPIRMTGSESDVTDRKLMEQALRASETRFAAFMTHLPGAAFIKDEAGRHVFANQGFEQVVGLNRNDWYLKTNEELFPPDIAAAFSQHDQTLRMQEHPLETVETTLYENETRHWLVKKYKIPGEQTSPGFIGGIAIDITERKQAEAALWTSEEQLRLAMEGSTDALWDARVGPDHHWTDPAVPLWWSPRIRQWLQLTESELFTTVGEWTDRLHPDDVAPVMAALAAHIEGCHAPYDIEYRLRTNCDTYLWVRGRGQAQWDEQGRPIRMSGSCQDITARKQADMALRESEGRTRSILETALDAVVSINESGLIIGWNPQAEILFGYSAHDVLGRPLDETIIPARYREAHAHGMNRIVRGNGESATKRRFEFFALHRSGQEFPVEFAIAASHVDGQPMFTAFIRDIAERKQAEEALRESEERYRTLVELSPSGVFVFSEGQTVYVNSMAMTILGATEPNDILARAPFEFIHPDYHEDVTKNLRRVLAGEATAHRVEQVYLKVDGTPIHVQVEAVRITWNGKPAIQSFFSDITERKQMEDRLRTTQYAVDHAADSIFFIGHNGYFLDVNESACRRLGYTKQELLTMSVMDIDPDFLPAVWDSFWEKFKRTKLVHLETRHRSKSGEIYPVEVTANYLLHNGQEIDCAIVRDITERKQAEEALRRSEQQLRTVLDTLPIGVWFTDEKGHVLYGNPVGHRIWAEAARVGLPQPGGDGLWWETIAQPESPHRWAVGAVLARGHDMQNETLAIETRTGERRTIRNSAVPVKSDAGEILGAIVLNENITDRVRAEKALLQEHALLMAVMDAATDIIFVKDLEGRYIHINRAGAYALGMPVEEVIGWHDYAIWPSELAASCQLADRRVLETGEPVTVEETSVYDGVTTIYLTTKAPYRNSEGQIIGVIGVARDITERKRAEQALRDSEERYRSLVDGAPIGIYVNENGLFSYLNKEMVRILKADCAEDLVGTLVMERIAPEYHQVVRERIQTLVTDHKPVPPLDELYLCLDGSRIDVAVTAIPAPFGGATAMQVLVLDITERKRAEEALRASEERFAKAFRSSPYPVVISELESGLFIDANDAAYQAFGYQREDVASRTSTELHLWPTPDHRMQFVGQLRQAGAIRNLEIDLRMRNGELRHCLVSAELIELYGKRCMVTVGTDITEQKRAEEALREQHALLSAIMNTTMDIIFVKDLQGHYLHMNPAGARVVGRPLQEIVGKDDDAIWPADLAACCKEADLQILAIGCTQTMEESTLANGKRITYLTTKAPYRDAAGNMIGIIGVAHDISQIKQSEEDLRRSHAFIRQIIDTDPNFIFAKDREGRFTLVNKAVADAYGTTVDHLTGKTDADFNFNTRALARFRKIDLEVLDSLREQFVPEEMITDAAGRTRWLQTVKRPILDESGLATMVLGACTDITERKRMEETLRQRERDLRTALDERERISQDLHDGILQSLYAVGLGLEACKPLMTQRHYKKAAASMDRAIGHLNHVMSEVRNFIAGLESQILQGSTFPMALRTMVLTLTADHPIPCTLTIDESLANTFSTEQALHLLNVVREALSNSLRHAGATKTTVSLKSLSRSMRLTIADNGRGFDPASMHGAGHGLANMEARVRKIGGRFAIRSVPQHGTRITIDLPKENRHAESESEHGSTAARR